jgi:hypothetical protein
MREIDRRQFLTGLGGGLAAGAGALGALRAVSPARAEEAKVNPEAVRFAPEMETVVRWIESTGRDRILEAAVEELRRGLSYRQLLGGLFLAGIRNISPRPIGSKFHAVMVIESAHQLGLDSTQTDRLFPLFWALDNFKEAQDRDVRAGDWSLGPVKDAAVPSAGEARKRFAEAMERWDEEAADAAVAGLCRGRGPGEVMEILWPYGARDWHNLGHKVIFTAQAFRTLQTIGWEHAEPVLRSLAYGLLDGGASETAAPYAANQALASGVRDDWALGRPDAGATTELLAGFRQAKPDEAARAAVAALGKGVAPESIWDAVLLAACDLLARRPGILALHAVTVSNALHHGFGASAVPATRLLLLLQACSWIPLFREAVKERSGLPDGPRLDELKPAEGDAAPGVDEVFQEASRDRAAAARKTLAHVARTESMKAFMDAGRGLVYRKGNDTHDFKFAAAAFEEIRRAAPRWRPLLLAASAFQLPAAGEPDSPLFGKMQRALAAL